MKKLASYLNGKEIAIPVIIFVLGILIATLSKKFFAGSISNIVTIIGCLMSMSATEMLAKEITRIRMYEDEKNKNN